MTIDEYLNGNCSTLYKRIRQIACEELNLPFSDKKRLKGFGKFDDYFMFWINMSKNVCFFNCRVSYEKNAYQNIKRVIFAEKNTEIIIQLVYNIYANYKKHDTETTLTANGKIPFAVMDLFDKALSDLKKHIAEQPETNMLFPKVFLSNRLAHLLDKNKVRDFNDLAKLSTEAIICWDYCGQVTIKELIELINTFISNRELMTHQDSASFSDDFRKAIASNIATSSYRLTRYNEANAKIYANYAKIMADALIEFFEKNKICDRNYEIWSCYYGVDKTKSSTLQIIGNRYELTRERIRQIIDKFNERVKIKFVRDNAKSCSEIINATLNQIGVEKFFDFIKYGFLKSYSSKFVKLFLSIAFTPEIASNVTQICIKQSVKKSQIKYENWFEANYCFPTDGECDLEIEKFKTARAKTSGYYKKIKNVISHLSDTTFYVEQPIVIYSQSFKTAHRPDFVIRTTNGKVVLIVLLPTINLCIYYNLKRFNDLREFCKQHNCGYIIMSDRFKTVYELMKYEVSSEQEQKLNEMIETNGSIVWKDIKDLKQDYRVTNETIVSYVIKNNLRFTLSPFAIRKFGDDETPISFTD